MPGYCSKEIHIQGRGICVPDLHVLAGCGHQASPVPCKFCGTLQRAVEFHYRFSTVGLMQVLPFDTSEHLKALPTSEERLLLHLATKSLSVGWSLMMWETTESF